MDEQQSARGPKRSADMTLVKDMQNDRIVYYWTDKQHQQISPLLASIPLADEWRTQYLHEAYEGRQRRTSSIDRRRYRHKRDMHQGRGNVSPLFSGGRRATDKEAKVTQDLAGEKLQALIDAHTPIIENDKQGRQQ